MTHSIEHEGTKAILTQHETQFDPDYLHGLTESVEKLGETDTSALILAGDHAKIWNQGMNIGWIAMNGGETAGIRLIQATQRFCGTLMKAPFPTIAAIGGHAFAGGALLAMACDWRVMGKSKGFFCFNEADLGVPIPRGFNDVVQAKVSPATLNKLFHGQRFTAEQALAHGIVNEAVEQDQVLQAALNLADDIGVKDKWTYGHIREGLYEKEIKNLIQAPLSSELQGMTNIVEGAKKFAARNAKKKAA